MTALHVMFDIDGTLLRSDHIDESCYRDSIADVLGFKPHAEWTHYNHVTDSGIVDQHIDECGLQAERERIQAEVKSIFIERIVEQLRRSPVEPVPGAIRFLRRLRKIDNLSLSIATGGWYESAKLKLDSAGIDVSGLAVATSSDHFSRTEIMKIAQSRATGDKILQPTYFGDGEWDRQACARLGFNFVLVGNRTRHVQQIPDFEHSDRALAFIGLPATPGAQAR